jgi:hypothetical protein
VKSRFSIRELNSNESERKQRKRGILATDAAYTSFAQRAALLRQSLVFYRPDGLDRAAAESG